jgi:hypothetical protein
MRAAPERGAKVFWFFFSKKNRLLGLFMQVASH